VTLLEARSRAGGRIHTISSPDDVPIELGAEFIHGRNELLGEIINSANRRTCGVPDRHLRLIDDELVEDPRFWERLSSALGKIDTASTDQSVASWLKHSDFPPELRQQVLDFAEGFHGGPGERMGIQGIAKAEAASAREDGQCAFRVLSGYSAVVNWLTAQALSKNVRAHFRSVVRIVRWESDRARVVFEPELPEKERVIEQMEMGHALRITLQFRQRFWPDNLGFIHSDHEWLPTWWSHDAHPIITGWAGGPRADCLGNEDSSTILSEAFGALDRLFRLGRDDLAELLVDNWHHNWSRDVFSCGAYSYAVVGGAELPRALAQPIEGTLFFAGEATNNTGSLGTVHGAIATGYRAAQEIISSLKNS
jgi:hypothetical protein